MDNRDLFGIALQFDGTPMNRSNCSEGRAAEEKERPFNVQQIFSVQS
jgi:hypothetical protein